VAEPHALLADRYRLVRQVGRGGMGVVWEAWDERLERPVAVKELKPQVGVSPEEAELAKNRAMREARITARLHHRNAVPVFDVVEHAGLPCLIMQFLPSVPLSAVLREGGPLGVHEAAEVGAQVASALAAAHALDIVHRDVKPGNILIADDGTALISDFGISHALGDATLTSTGLVHGTPAYLAPEVARGADSSFASDVFSLGATLYATLEGGPPFGTDANSIALLYKVASGEFAPPRRAGALTPLLMAMLKSDPGARPAMRDVASRLAAVEVADAATTETFPPPTAATGVEASSASTTAIRASREDGPPAFVADPPAADVPAGAARAVDVTAATLPAGGASSAVPPAAPPEVPAAVPAAAPAAVPAADPPSVPPAPPELRPSRRRRRRGRVLAAVALVVGLVVLGAALVTGQLGRGGNGTAAGPATTDTATAAAPSESRSESGADPSSTATTSAGSPKESPSPSETTESPSPDPTSTKSSGEPTKAELEQAITTYYSLVPGNTDDAWPLLTKDYQRNTSGGRQAYERFWDEVDRVSVGKLKADPPDQVDATVTYRRGDAVAVERTSFRLVRKDGILKIDKSTVLSSS
jgi:eukaryotic-like serine/threonine-protein kinase